MASWFCRIYLLILFRNVSADSPSYSIHQAQVSFDRALRECSPAGVLTTLATEREVADILGIVSESSPGQNSSEFTFWVGLRKVKNECVVPTLPLRGFKWTEDGGEASQVSRWAEEPRHTCTTVRCAALSGELQASTVTRWGLIPVTCKNTYRFICKLRDTGAAGKSTTPEPQTSEPEPAIPEPQTPEPAIPEPQTPEPAIPEPQTPEPAMPEPEPATPEPQTPEPEPATPEPEPQPEPQPEPEPEPEPKSEPESEPEPGPELAATESPKPKLPTRGPEPKVDLMPGSGPGSDPAPGCQNPVIPGSRFFTLDRDNRSRIQVDCWSGVQLDLRCSGHPAVWRLLDDTPANFTAVCVPCPSGFQKDASGNCVDVDECGGGGGGPCRHTCLNTEGSYSCFCSDENGKHHDEDSLDCMDDTATGGILMPVLVAVATLAVLVVVVAVTVKCCLMRRSKKRAMKKAEKMAMKSKDSFDTANEKAAA